MAAIEVTDLRKVYRVARKREGLRGSLIGLFHRERDDVLAVDDISFRIETGEIVGFLGPNGAGKTTTLKMLSGLLYPSGGQARVLGYVPWARADGFRRRFSVVLGQKNQLWWDLPAHDSFLLNREIYRIPKVDFDQRVAQLAAMLRVEDKLHVQVRKLSLGERMKVELIAALLHRPAVLFLDEPTLGLDVVSQRVIREFLKEYNRIEGTTIILTSHYMADITALCRRVMVINHGHLLFDGDLSRLVDRYAAERAISLTIEGEPPTREALERYGRVSSYEPPRVELRVPRQEVARVTRQALGELAVGDLAVEEPPIEEVIERYFEAGESEEPSPLAAPEVEP